MMSYTPIFERTLTQGKLAQYQVELPLTYIQTQEHELYAEADSLVSFIIHRSELHGDPLHITFSKPYCERCEQDVSMDWELGAPWASVRGGPCPGLTTLEDEED